jgi:hypothetical protein
MTIALVDWMVDGYDQALDRLRAKTASGDAGERETFLPLFEALNRAASIDVYFDEAKKPIQNDLLTAVRFARNRVHHQWRALRRYDSPGVTMVVLATSSSRIVGPPPGFWWYWVDLDDLQQGRSSEAEENAYSAQLAGKPANETLEDLRPVLRGAL